MIDNIEEFNNNLINYHAIGEQIKKARNKANMTQEELAELVETSSNYISNIERGLKHASFDMLLKIAKVLETRLDFFLQNEYSEKILDESLVQEISLLVNNLSQNKRHEFLILIKKIAEGLEEIEKKSI